MENLQKLNNKTLREKIITPAEPEKASFIEKGLDAYIEESENLARGIENNKVEKVTADEMIVVLTNEKALVDEKIAYARTLGLETVEEERVRLEEVI